MKVSVIIPIYNVEKYLEKCLDSIVHQSYKNLEIILVNDGSTDSSSKICEDYQKKDERIIVINKENGGLSDARNKGIDIATGEYITFIDSDDYIHKDMIGELMNIATNNDADISVCGFQKFFNESDSEIIDNMLLNTDIQLFNSQDILDNFYSKISVNIIVAWAKIYKMSLFNKIRYNKGKIHEDEFIAHKLIFESKKIAYIPKKMYFYRIRKNSITGEKFNKKRLDKIEALEDRLKFANEKNLKNLYMQTLFCYCNDLILCYYLIKENYKKEKKLQKILKDKFLNNYKNVLRSNKMNIKQKIRIIMERIIPSISAKIIIKHRRKE